MEGNTAAVDATIVLDICGASETHGSSNIAFTPNGDMLIAAGDGAQYDNIDGIQGAVMSLYIISTQCSTSLILLLQILDSRSTLPAMTHQILSLLKDSSGLR